MSQLLLFGGQKWPNVSPICSWMSIHHAFRAGRASKLGLIGHSWGGHSYSHTIMHFLCVENVHDLHSASIY